MYRFSPDPVTPDCVRLCGAARQHALDLCPSPEQTLRVEVGTDTRNQTLASG